MNKIKNKIELILKEDSRLWVNQELNQTLLLDLVDKIDEKIISLLLSDNETREKFFIKILDSYVFKTNEFKFFMEENKVNNSFTDYKNRIGLTDGKRFLKDTKDIVLDFPYKDCILEGGQSNEDGMDSYYEWQAPTYKDKLDENGNKIKDGRSNVKEIDIDGHYDLKKAKRNEVFFNQVLAKDEIDRLLDDKALVNWKRFTANGECDVGTIKRDSDGTIKENLIIKGNNLLALHSLKNQYTGKVKLIYIDPPYNTGSDSFAYNDKFNHSTWLTFMKNRLEIARDLLRDDGVIFVQCDDNEQAYLKVLMDEVFNSMQLVESNFINLITVKTKIGGVSGSSEGKSFRDSTEFINVFCKNKDLFEFQDIRINTPLFEYISSYVATGKSWKYTSIITELCGKSIVKQSEDYTIYKYKKFSSQSIQQYALNNKLDVESVYHQFSNKIFRTTNAQSSVRQKVIKDTVNMSDEIVSIEYSPTKGKNKDAMIEIFYKGSARNMVMFLSDTTDFIDGKYYYSEKISNLWLDIQYNNLAREGGINLTNGKKPEALIQRIIELSTNKGDIVLDYHLGSGTTAAVAHKIGRQYIGIEQMDYIEDLAVTRLKNVIGKVDKSEDLLESETKYTEFDNSGISKSVNWQGGGELIYCELAKWNEQAKDKILACDSLAQLTKLFDKLYSRYFLNYNLKIKEFQEKVITEPQFIALPLEQQQAMFLTMLDLNQMYVQKTEMADSKYGICSIDQQLTADFYDNEK